MNKKINKKMSLGLILIISILIFSFNVNFANAQSSDLLTLKWSNTFTNTQYGQVFPVMGDITGDGNQEIVFAAGDLVHAFDAASGTKLWTAQDGANRAVELVDLNNDGILEVLHTTNDQKVRALNGDGSILWTSPTLKGRDQALFPLLAYDINGDGYPTIYFASSDTYPRIFSGNMDDYNGALTMLDHQGNVLKETWLYHPCWGGLSLADPDYDGKFIIYVSDRRSGYAGMEEAKGLQAYDAETLNLEWSRGDIFHSSPMAVLDDVNKDGTLDVIAQQIVYSGVGVLNAFTGQTLSGYNYFSQNLPTHGTGTVYDIDGDGNLEIILAVDDNSDYPKEFTVFDLVTGSIKFNPHFDFWFTWPPEVGDVTGDGDMEIIAASGNQGSAGDYPLLIYNKNYELIDRMDFKGAGQLMPAKVFDVDNDGLNEVVIIGLTGQIYVYETLATTPNPAPRTETQRYSEYRRGAAEYVEPPGPKAPLFRNVFPQDSSTNMSLTPTLSVNVYDYQKELLNIEFEINDGNGWVELETFNDETNREFNIDTTEFANQYDTNYLWRITATDSNGNTNQQTYSFLTTQIQSWTLDDWNYRKQVVIDSSQVVEDLTDFPVLVEFTDSDLIGKTQSDGDDLLFTLADGSTKLNHEIESFDSSTGNLVAWVNVPSLSSTQNTILYMYYDNPDADNQETPQEVWDSNYLAVHHFDETSGSIIDSTTNNNDGTSQNGVNLNVEGRIDGGSSFDGLDDRILLPQIFTTQTEFTIEGWMKSDTKHGYAISQWLSNQGMYLQYFPGEENFQLHIAGSTIKKSASANNWHYVVATFDGRRAKLYINAGEPSAGASNPPTWPNDALYIGDRSSGNRAFLGSIDELKISDVARSEGYIKTTYNNQNNPNNFIKIGSEETSNGELLSPIISNITPANGEVNVSTSTSEISFDLFHPQNYSMNYTLSTNPDIGSNTGVNLDNGHYVVSIDNLQNSTTYTWYLNVTDSNGNTNQQTYTFQTTQTQSGPGTLDDWNYRKQVVIDSSQVVEDLTDFPVLVEFTDSDLIGKTQSDGDDLLFTLADGSTKLNHEIESFDSSTGNLVAWVNVPSLSSTQNTILYMYYDNSDADNQETPQEVWDSNYLAVHHFDETSGSIIDSTTNNNDGTSQNGVNLNVEGRIDGGNSFDGLDDRIALPQIFTTQTEFTIEGWMKSELKHGYAVSQWSTINEGVFIQYFPNEGNFQLYVNNNIIKQSAPMSVWNYVVATYNGTTAKLYINGEDPSTGNFNAPIWPNQPLFVGDRSAGNRAFLGSLDEIRLSDIARSDAYIKTSYNNQNNPNSFMAIGSEESLTVGSLSMIISDEESRTDTMNESSESDDELDERSSVNESESDDGLNESDELDEFNESDNEFDNESDKGSVNDSINESNNRSIDDFDERSLVNESESDDGLNESDELDELDNDSIDSVNESDSRAIDDFDNDSSISNESNTEESELNESSFNESESNRSINETETIEIIIDESESDVDDERDDDLDEDDERDDDERDDDERDDKSNESNDNIVIIIDSSGDR